MVLVCYFYLFSDFIYFGALSFFLMSLFKGLPILFIYLRNHVLDSLILVLFFLVPMSFNSAKILIVSFLLFALGFFVVFHLVVLEVGLGYLF